MQCPGPIMRLSKTIGEIENGQAVQIAVLDPAFPEDVKAWCQSTGNTLVNIVPEQGGVVATIAKGSPRMPDASALGGEMLSAMSKKKSIVVFSGDFDKAMAAFIIANGAATMGSEVTLFFTFWGLNILRKPEKVSVSKNMIEKMFGWMMPRGANKAKLSQMNMAGMGLGMIKGIMRKKNVPSLPELIKSAQEAGVRLVACTMTMDLMGIKREELIDGIEEGGVAMYLNNAEKGNVNLFI
ncbi:MAG: DsrE/DsrF/DrsH-like family protein [bacterium]